MRLAMLLSFGLIACTRAPAPSAPPANVPAAPPVVHCPYIRGVSGIWPWLDELFPSCAPAPLGSSLVHCDGPCPKPCGQRHQSGGMPPFASSSSSSFRYDDRGRWVATIGEAGRESIRCTWRGEHLDACVFDDRTVKAVRDAAGRITAFSDGETTTAVRRDGEVVHAIGDVNLTYDIRGQIVAVGEETIHYDGRGRVTHVIDPRFINTYTYDERDRIVRVTSVRHPVPPPVVEPTPAPTPPVADDPSSILLDLGTLEPGEDYIQMDPAPLVPPETMTIDTDDFFGYDPEERYTLVRYDDRGRIVAISSGKPGGSENDGWDTYFLYDCP